MPERSTASSGPDSARLDLTVSPDGHPVEVTVRTHVHDEPGVVRRRASVRNIGDRPLRLERLTSLQPPSVGVRPPSAQSAWAR